MKKGNDNNPKITVAAIKSATKNPATSPKKGGEFKRFVKQG